MILAWHCHKPLELQEEALMKDEDSGLSLRAGTDWSMNMMNLNSWCRVVNRLITWNRTRMCLDRHWVVALSEISLWWAVSNFHALECTRGIISVIITELVVVSEWEVDTGKLIQPLVTPSLQISSRNEDIYSSSFNAVSNPFVYQQY
jgi:hypothetical protein